MKINKRAYEANEYDFDSLMRTQPEDRVHHYAKYTKIPSGYMKVLYVYEVSATGLKNHWLSDLSSEKNTILEISEGVEDPKTFEKRLNKAYREYFSNKDRADQTDNITEQFKDDGSAMWVLTHNVKTKDDNAHRVYIRLKVFAKTKHALDMRVREIIGKYSDFKFTVLRDYQHDEHKSFWVPAMRQEDILDEHLLGMSISSSDLGGSFWPDHQQLNDPRGSMIGTSFTGGVINLNMYLRNKNRTRPFMLIMGKPGFGKSTLQKIQVEDSIKRGNRVVMFDPSNEYDGITENAGGITVPLDGSAGIINPFQPFPTVTSIKKKRNDITGQIEEVEEVDIIASFEQHIEKLLSIYGFMSQGLTQENLSEDRISLNVLLTNFYIEYHFWSPNPQRDLEKLNLFDLPVNRYPILNDFMQWVKEQQRASVEDYTYKEKLPISVLSFNRIIGTFTNMARTHGSKFNGHTSIPDLSKEDIVRYDVGMLLSSPSAFNAQVFSALAMEQANIINNGRRQRRLRQHGKIRVEEAKHTLIVLDEAQNYISLDNAYNLKFILKILQQMRKTYAALMMAMPTIKNVVIPDAQSNDARATEYYSNVKDLFDLMQYRIFFLLSASDALDSLTSVLKDSISPAELNQITLLEKGSALLNIDTEQNILMNVIAEKYQLERFHGGD